MVLNIKKLIPKQLRPPGAQRNQQCASPRVRQHTANGRSSENAEEQLSSRNAKYILQPLTHKATSVWACANTTRVCTYCTHHTCMCTHSIP